MTLRAPLAPTRSTTGGATGLIVSQGRRVTYPPEARSGAGNGVDRRGALTYTAPRVSHERPRHDRRTRPPGARRGGRLRPARRAPQRPAPRRRLRALPRGARVRVAVHDLARLRRAPGRAQRRDRRHPGGDDARVVP